MPLTKRHLYDSYLYGPGDLYEESPQENILEDIAMSQKLGALHQIRFLAMFTVEVKYSFFLSLYFFIYFFVYISVFLCLYFLYYYSYISLI